MDGRPTWTDCNEAGDNVVPNVLSPRALVFRPDNMDETVPHTRHKNMYFAYAKTKAQISERTSTQRIVWDPIFRGSVFWRLR